MLTGFGSPAGAGVRGNTAVLYPACQRAKRSAGNVILCLKPSGVVSKIFFSPKGHGSPTEAPGPRTAPGGQRPVDSARSPTRRGRAWGRQGGALARPRSAALQETQRAGKAVESSARCRQKGAHTGRGPPP